MFAVFLICAVLSSVLAFTWRQIWTESKRLLASPFGLGLAIVALFWLPSVFTSNFPLRSFEASYRTFFFIIAAVFLYVALSETREIKDMTFKVFIGAAAVTIIFALYVQMISTEPYWFLRLHGWRSNPIGTKLKGFSAISVLIIPLLMLGTSRQKGGWRLAGIVTSLGFLLLVIDTYNRAAVAGLVATIITVVIAILLRRRSRSRIIAALIGLLAMIVATIAWLKLSRLGIGRDVAGLDWSIPIWLIDFERQTIWGHTLEIVYKAPWFGIGANTINFSPGADQIIFGTSHLHIIPSHPHNWFLEVLAETGIVGAAALTTFVTAFGIKLAMNYRASGHPAYLCALGLMAGYWGSGLFNFSFWSGWWQTSFFIAMAISLAETARPPSGES